MIGHRLWAVDACTTDADHPRTANPRAWDVPADQLRALVARQREQAAEQSANRLRAFLAPTHTTPKEGRL